MKFYQKSTVSVMRQKECEECGRRYHESKKACIYCGVVNWDHFELTNNPIFSRTASQLRRHSEAGSNVQKQLLYEDDLQV